MKKTILVTGGAGFLGSHVADRLLEAGHDVVVIDNLDGGSRDNVPEKAHFLLVDICDVAAVQRVFSHIKFDAIIHCAAFAAENLSHRCRLHTYKSIVLGSANLVNNAVNFGCPLFISMSSIAVYGMQQPPFSEEDTPQPCDPYGAAKACMEADLKAAHDVYGLNYAIFRPHNIIGTRQSLADSTRNVASIFIRQLLEGNPMTVFGDGTQTRAWSPVSHVSKVVAHTILSPSTWNQTYNVGGEQAMTVLALARMIARLDGKEAGIQFLPKRHEAEHAYSLHEKTRHFFTEPYLGPQETLEECLRGMLAEAKKRQLPPLKLPPPDEITKCTS